MESGRRDGLSGMEAAGRGRFFYRAYFHIFLIALTGLLIYSNTFNSPFQWDEQTFLKENPVIRDLSYFASPSKAKDLEFYGALKNRYIGYLTFALEYKIHGLDVRGYHVFNFAVHIINSLLVYLLVVLAFRTPFLAASRIGENSRFIAFFTALLFVSHPIQTEAVTYIFQRLASLQALFYLASLAFYAKWRLDSTEIASGRSVPRNDSHCERSEAIFADNNPPLAKGGIKGGVFYVLSLLSAVLAMKTKENAFTLPIVVVLFEFLFFSGPVGRRLLKLAPIMLTMLIIPLSIFADAGRPALETAGSLGAADFERDDYLYTQIRVVMTYLRLLVLPINQNIDYDYPLSTSLFDADVFLSFLFFLFMLGGAFYLYRRSRLKNNLSRLIAFGIFWFFITLAVESSVIPLPMLIDEYRLYLPSIGVFLSVITGAFLLLEKLENKAVQKTVISAVVLVPVLLSVSAYMRNALWGNQTRLWQDVVDKSPAKARGHNNLGLSLLAKGEVDGAVGEFKAAIEIDPGSLEAYNNLGLAYAEKRRYAEATKQYLSALALKGDFAEAHNNLGRVYEARGLMEKAVESYREALKHRPLYAEAHNNLGLAFGSMGRYDKAMEHYEAALKIKPGDPEILYNLGIACLDKGDYEAAERHLRRALDADPRNVRAREFLDYALSMKKGR